MNSIKTFCFVCGENKTFTKKFTIPKFIWKERFSIFVCPECELGKTVPVPGKLINVKKGNLNIENLKAYKKASIRLIQILKENSIIPPKYTKALDIGCGLGILMEELKNLGFDVIGVDYNKDNVKFCQLKGLKVYKADAYEINKLFKKEKFDIIILSAILEHLEDPQRLINIVKNMLSKEGVILISQVVYDALFPKFFPWFWYGWQPYEHYWHFTERTFRKWLIKEDFEIIAVYRDSLIYDFSFNKNIIKFFKKNINALIGKTLNSLGNRDSIKILYRKS